MDSESVRGDQNFPRDPQNQRPKSTGAQPGAKHHAGPRAHAGLFGVLSRTHAAQARGNAIVGTHVARTMANVSYVNAKGQAW